MLISNNSKQIKMANPIFSATHCHSSVTSIIKNDGSLEDNELSSLVQGLYDESFCNIDQNADLCNVNEFNDWIDTDLPTFGSLFGPGWISQMIFFHQFHL